MTPEVPVLCGLPSFKELKGGRISYALKPRWWTKVSAIILSFV